MSMEAPKPVPIEMPAPCDEASMLALYLEGVPLVQIARALQVGIPTVLDFIRTREVRECIEQYEESIERQTRLFALASRIPAMTTLREVCASEGSLAERRRAASDLLRQSRAAEKPAKGQRFNRSPHRTSTPDKFMPNPDIEPLPEVPAHSRLFEPYELNADLNSVLNVNSPVDSQTSPPIASTSPREILQNQTSTPASNPDQAPAPGSFVAHDHTASWHAFERNPLNSPAPNLSSVPIPQAAAAASHDQPQSEQLDEPQQPTNPPVNQSINPPANPQVNRIPSPYDLICPPEISTPLPDAVPVAA